MVENESVTSQINEFTKLVNDLAREGDIFCLKGLSIKLLLTSCLSLGKITNEFHAKEESWHYKKPLCILKLRIKIEWWLMNMMHWKCVLEPKLLGICMNNIHLTIWDLRAKITTQKKKKEMTLFFCRKIFRILFAIENKLLGKMWNL